MVICALCAEKKTNNTFIIFSNCIIEVIHRYLHGTYIKAMLRNSKSFKRFDTVSDIHNMGITYLVFA